MDTKSSQSSLLQNLKFKPEYLIKAAPLGVAVALASASFLPMIRAGSPEMLMGATLLSGLGTDIIKDFIKKKILLLGKKTDAEILKETENEILKLWNAPDEKGVKFRRELSQFLRQNGILQMALNDTPDEMKGALVDSFAKLANDFDEFSWVLTDIQKLLVETSAMVRHNVEISNEILTKVNLLAKIQREREEKPTPPTLSDEGESDDLPPADIPCPYKGLAAFQPQDVEYFYGRETLTAQLLANLAGASFLAVVGPSGSGKSSLVRAGVIPALWSGEIPGSENWKTLIMRPGTAPLEELGVCVSSESKSVASDLVEGLRKSEQALRLELKKYLLNQSQDAKFILVVDQFEEIFTQCKDESEREKFIAAVVDAAQNGDARIVVILTLRADFYGHCAPYPALAKLLSENQVLVGAMSADELRRAINLPAEKVGLVIEPGLVDLILEEVQGEAGSLPMISHALVETWKLRRGRWLKVDAYRSFGGVKKAIASTADEVFAKFTEAEREQVRDIFLRLTRVNENAASGEYRDARQRVLLRDLIPAGGDAAQTERLLDELTKARLIVKDMGRDSQVEVEVAHEALITHWDKLRGWLNENRESLRLHQNVSEAAHDWLANGRDENLLVHRGGRLEDALELRAKLNSGEKDYLDACVALITKEQRERERRLRYTVIASIVVAIIFLILGSFGLVKSNEAISQASTATFAQGAAQQQVATADSAKATALSNENLAAEARTEAQQQALIAISRQLAAQAQSIVSTRNSKQLIAALLATQSMKLLSSSEASQILLNNNNSAHPIAHLSHQNTVFVVDFSPDGNYVATGSWDNSARLWNADTGEQLQRIDYNGNVNAITFSPNGELVASVSDDGKVLVWKVASGQISMSAMHDSAVLSVAFSPDGRYLGTGSWDKTVRIWDISNAEEITRVKHDDVVYSVDFSPDGKFIGTGSWDNTVRVWDVFSGTEMIRMHHEHRVDHVVFSPDGRYILSAGWDNTARIWDASSGSEISRMTHQALVYDVDFSPNGKYAVSGSEDNTAVVWDILTGQEIAHFTHDFSVRSVAFSSNGNYIVSASWDNTARVWESMTGREIARMTHNNVLNQAVFSPDGKRVISGSYDGSGWIWDVHTGQLARQFNHGDAVYSMPFSPDGNYLASASEDGSARVWEVASGLEKTRISHSDTVFDIAWSPNGKHVVSGSFDGTARVWESTSGLEISRMAHFAAVRSVDFSPNGDYVLSSDWGNMILIWNSKTGQESVRFTQQADLNSIAYSSNWDYVVTGSDDNLIRVWGIDTGLEIAKMKHEGIVYSVAISPDSKFIGSGSADGTARLWDAATQEEIFRKDMGTTVANIAFSPDGRYLIGASWNYLVIAWEVSTGEEVMRIITDDRVTDLTFSKDSLYLAANTNKTIYLWNIEQNREITRINSNEFIYSVEFSTDGKYVLSMGKAGVGQLWYWHPKDLIIQACEFFPRNLTRAEWDQYIGDALPYQAVCPNLPIEP